MHTHSGVATGVRMVLKGGEKKTTFFKSLLDAQYQNVYTFTAKKRGGRAETNRTVRGGIMFQDDDGSDP